MNLPFRGLDNATFISLNLISVSTFLLHLQNKNMTPFHRSGLKVEICGYFTLPATKKSENFFKYLCIEKSQQHWIYAKVSQRKIVLSILYDLCHRTEKKRETLTNISFQKYKMSEGRKCELLRLKSLKEHIREFRIDIHIHISYLQTSYIFKKKCFPFSFQSCGCPVSNADCSKEMWWVPLPI